MAVLRFFVSTVFVTLLITAILSLCLWFFGPLLGLGDTRPLDGALVRGIVIGVIWFAVILFLVIRAIRSRRRETALAHEIAAVDPAEEALAEELAELKSKLGRALQTLRKSKKGRKHLYELPWYVIIGPPGAGKTTAIVNSGLRFPLKDKRARMSPSAASAAPATATGGSPTTR